MSYKRIVMLFVTFMLSIGLAFSVYAQKQPFPEDWAQDAGPEPEEVPEVDERGAVNVALLSNTSPNASSVIPGYEDRHSIEFLNDGWYNNPRSWITGENPPVWVEIDLGSVYMVDKVVFGSEHTPHWEDRAIEEFSVLVATEYNADSNAETWTEVFNYAGDPVRDTTPFTFDPADARWVRIDILAGDGCRIDELEIYAVPDATAVDKTDKMATIWGKIKIGK
ncbi:hypothetical protein GF312_12330 [Candidatus Poribacteria bacterium]|nr:hypothetical protein [Candidatus Poribacteria bacterium]